MRGPELPPLPADGEWPEATVAWWESWRRAPQAQAMVDSDWVFLLDTAVLHAQFWNGNMSVAPELRLRVAKFGATPEDRMRLRMTIGEPESKRPASRRSSARLKVVG